MGKKKYLYTPSIALRAIFDPLGYEVLNARAAGPGGLLGHGLIVLAHKRITYETPTGSGPWPALFSETWATWLVKDGAYLGHYFETEAEAKADFEARA